MRYKTKRKTGTYEHFCILVLAQDSWKENDREVIRNISLTQRKKVREHDYHFYHRLTYRDTKPEYSTCLLCNQIYQLFVDLQNRRDSILYQGHHYVMPEDYGDLLGFTRLLLAEEKVKKIYVLYLDSLNEFKREEIENFNYEKLKSLIVEEKKTLDEFETELLNHEFSQRTLHEIIKQNYY